MDQFTIEQPTTDVVSFSGALTKEQVDVMKSGKINGVTVYRKDTMPQVHCAGHTDSLNRNGTTGLTLALSFGAPGAVDAELMIEESEGEYFQRVDDLRSTCLIDESDTIPPLIVTYSWSEDVKV